MLPPSDSPHFSESERPLGSEVNPEPAGPGPVHRPVMLEEVLTWLDPKPGQVLIDGTAGAGGHTAELAKRVAPGGRVIGLDRDPAMLALAAQAVEGLPVTLVHSPYDRAREVLENLEFEAIDGMLLDLGLSSDQLAWRDRGFSFATDGPLDMRFDPGSGGPTAADLIQRSREEELADLFYELGEERKSRRIARRIVERRKRSPIRTTGELADIIRSCMPRRPGQIDPATRAFQALRIAVNDELGRLDRILDETPGLLRPGGRMAVISFHSLEDRRVKQAFRSDPRWHALTKKVVVATDTEVRSNPRSRSAKLRVAERCPTPTATG